MIPAHIIPPARADNPYRSAAPASSHYMRLMSACVRLLMSYPRTSFRLTSSFLSQLGTSREFLSVQSTLATPLGSVRISGHSLCTFFPDDDSSRPFQSPRFRYSCIRHWVVHWSPCALGSSTRPLCSRFDVAGNLSGGSRSLYAFELKPTAVLGTSSTLSNPAFFKIGMHFFIASFPVHNRFQTSASRPHAVGSVSTRIPPIFSIRMMHFRPDCVAVAQLIFPGTSTEASLTDTF